MKHIAKRLFVSLFIAFSVIIATVTSSSAYAYDVDLGPGNNNATSTSSGSDIGDCNNTFLGMAPWYCGVKSDPQNEEELKENIWKIAFNIFVDIGTIAVYLAIGYIIYGGYLYMFSSGDVGKAAMGKKTLARAAIGLGIIMLANVILNTIRIVLLSNGKTFQECNPTTDPCIDPDMLIRNLIDWVIGSAGIVAAVFVVIGGVGYMTSQGDPGKLQKAKATILYAIIGLIIVALSRAILVFVYKIIDENSDPPISTTSIVQEANLAFNLPDPKNHHCILGNNIVK